MPLRVATFNIHHGEGLDRRIDLDRIARVIRSSGAEFVALQELDRGLERSGGEDQPADLSELLQMPVHFFPTFERSRGAYGIAIACADAEEPHFVHLPQVGDEEPRGAISTRWRDYSVIATHLSQHPAAREEQLSALMAKALEIAAPTLLMGDFNCGRSELRLLGRAGFRTASGWRRTTDRGSPRQIDHSLAGPGAQAEGAFTVGGGASDHRLLAADIAPDS